MEIIIILCLTIVLATLESVIFYKVRKFWKNVFNDTRHEKILVKEIMDMLPSTINIKANMVKISEYKETYEDMRYSISELDKNEYTIRIKGHYNKIMEAYNKEDKDIDEYSIWKDYIIKNAELLNNEVRQYNFHLNS